MNLKNAPVNEAILIIESSKNIAAIAYLSVEYLNECKVKAIFPI